MCDNAQRAKINSERMNPVFILPRIDTNVLRPGCAYRVPGFFWNLAKHILYNILISLIIYYSANKANARIDGALFDYIS